MARVLFVTWNGGGNLLPALGIARVLADRGHAIAFLGQQTQQRRVEVAGFAFIPYASIPAWESTAPPSATEAQALVIRDIWLNTDMTNDVVALLARQPADLVVVDCMLAGVLAGSQAFGVPTVVLVHSLYASTLPARDALVARGNQLRMKVGLPPIDADAVRWESKDLVLVTTLHELDAVEADPVPNVRYVGPVFERQPLPIGWDLPWVAAIPRPLVLASFSTNPWQGSVGAQQQVLDALVDLPARVLLLTGGAIAPEALTPPVNAAVYGFVAHAAVMPYAALVLSNAGHGTVMSALVHGIPLVCRPSLAADQPIIAARVEALGAGRAVPPDANAQEIRSPVAQVLGTPAYGIAAQRLAALIAREDGAVRGAAELEACLSSLGTSPAPQLNRRVPACGS
jgi:UDP:flavonoid glycosyltransferase YjiC (YdhE family)